MCMDVFRPTSSRKMVFAPLGRTGRRSGRDARSALMRLKILLDLYMHLFVLPKGGSTYICLHQYTLHTYRQYIT